MGSFLFKVAFIAVCGLILVIALPIVVISILILVIGMFAVLLV